MKALITASAVCLALAAFVAPGAVADKASATAAHSCMRSGPASFYGDDKSGVVTTRDGRAYAVALRGVCLNISRSWGVEVSLTRPGAMDLCDNHDGALHYADQNILRSCRVDTIRRLQGDEAKPYLSGGPKKN